MTGDGPWSLIRRQGPAAALHGLEIGDAPPREVWVLTPDRPALVLGSTQRDDIVATAALDHRGIDLVVRRSGGGAVLLDPTGAVTGAATLWIDLVVPRADPLWLDDVGRSMAWLGDAWVAGLATVGVEGEVHRGALERTAASSLVCFAGVGPGEVVAGTRKVVGISQRRTRAGARFQCLVNLAAGPPAPDRAPGGSAGVGPRRLEAIVDLLREPADATERAALAGRLRERTATVAATADALVDALVAALPAPTA